MKQLLEVRGLKTYFKTMEGTAKAVDDISFTINEGETYAMVGESGCGKSVTALSIMGLVARPAGFLAGGEVRLRGKEILRLPESEKQMIRGKDISMIFQEPMTSLNPVFTVGNQVIETILLHQEADKWKARALAVEMLRKVRIPDAERCYTSYPHELSGGMRQRVMIAMALACRPALLIADEPTTALDVTIQDQILTLLKELQKDMGMAVLLITHNLGIVREMAQRVGVMYAGKLVEECPIDTLFTDPKHPYTIRLLESLPNMQKRGTWLSSIPGTVPKATNYLEGCRFAERCHKVMHGCAEVLPKEVEVAARHRVACHLHDSTFKGAAITLAEPEVRAPMTGGSGAPVNGAEPLVKIKGLKVYFPIKKGVLQKTVAYVKAVDGVDLEIPKGQVMALVGESGCGKTTIGKALIRLVPSTDGSIEFDGQDLIKLKGSPLNKIRRRFQMIFQDPYSSLNPRLMVGEILQEGMQVHGIGGSRAGREANVKVLMQQVGLDPDMVHRYPHEFSGGQRQRIGIARALAVEPTFLVCDEATSALDVSVQAQILNLLKELQQKYSLTYLFITHDIGVVEYISDYVAVMYLGRVVEQGTTNEVLENPKHPYTKALLAAVPKIDPETGVKKIRLEGDVPSPVNPPAGCHFHPRCPDVMEKCKKEYPGLSAISKTRTCHCYLYP